MATPPTRTPAQPHDEPHDGSYTPVALLTSHQPKRVLDPEGRCTRGDRYIPPALARRERLALLAAAPDWTMRPGSIEHEHALRDADRARIKLSAVLAMEHGTPEAWETLNYWLEWDRGTTP